MRHLVSRRLHIWVNRGTQRNVCTSELVMSHILNEASRESAPVHLCESWHTCVSHGTRVCESGHTCVSHGTRV